MTITTAITGTSTRCTTQLLVTVGTIVTVRTMTKDTAKVMTATVTVINHCL